MKSITQKQQPYWVHFSPQKYRAFEQVHELLDWSLQLWEDAKNDQIPPADLHDSYIDLVEANTDINKVSSLTYRRTVKLMMMNPGLTMNDYKEIRGIHHDALTRIYLTKEHFSKRSAR